MTLLLKLLISTGVIGTAVSVPTIISLTANENISLNSKVDEVDQGLVSDGSNLAQPKIEIIKKEVLPSKSELEKLRERAANDNLCRNVASSTYDESFLRVCKVSENSSNVEFEYYTSKFSMPSPIRSLRFGTSELVITLKEGDGYGPKVIRMDLSSDILSGSGLFSSFAGGKEFTDRQCKLEVNNENKNYWRINCQQTV